MSTTKRILTGVKSTGMPHLGNYVGAIKPAIDLISDPSHEAFYFIADYHTLTTIHSAKDFSEQTYEVAATWLACGLDPKSACLYKQSDVPEVLEMNWILSCFTSKGLMNRAHAYKAIVQDNESKGKDADWSVNMGLYTYPILMASDILFINSDIVPVGADQLQHIEIARDIANSFNHHYGEIFKLPEASVKQEILVPGLDGRKMSKSYGNHIPLFLTEKKLRKTINKIATDSSAPEDPKNPEESLIFDLYKFFATANEIEALKAKYQTGIGWGEAKAELFAVVNRELSGPREIYESLMADKSQIDLILEEGAKRVRPLAQSFLTKVKKAIGALK